MPNEVTDILLVMRKEQREDMNKLGDRFEDGFKALQASIADESERRRAHELQDLTEFNKLNTRIAGVESPMRNIRRNLRWLAAAAITAILGGAADAYFGHIAQKEISHDARTGSQARGTDR